MSLVVASAIIPMTSRPFIQALLAYIEGNYSLESWTFLYPAVAWVLLIFSNLFSQ